MNFWTLWCKTLGNKISHDNKIADTAAILRTIWIILQVITCIAIIIGVVFNVSSIIHHW
jgi:hypothetical protein